VNLYAEHALNFGDEAVRRQGLLEEVRALLENESLRPTAGAASDIKADFRTRLAADGWALNVEITAGLSVKVNAVKRSVALQTQTGNVARAFYDLLKLQSMFHADKIVGGVLIVPSRNAARILGGNLASFERVVDELSFYRRTITMPLLILGFS
jgi:Restriction endonuclease BglII